MAPADPVMVGFLGKVTLGTLGSMAPADPVMVGWIDGDLLDPGCC